MLFTMLVMKILILKQPSKVMWYTLYVGIQENNALTPLLPPQALIVVSFSAVCIYRYII